MSKKTIISIIICFVLITALVFVQNYRAVKDSAVENETAVAQPKPEEPKAVSYKALAGDAKSTEFKFETNLFNITFDTEGASISSLTLKQHADADGTYSDIIFREDGDNNAFLLYWGDDYTKPVKDVFDCRTEGNKVIFTKSYEKPDGNEFTVVKTYEFRDNDYLFAVTVDITGDELTEGDYAYTLAYEPQVGPSFAKLKNNSYDYRHFYAGLVKNGKVKRSTVKLSNNQFVSTKDFDWFSLTSKYFTVIARPMDNTVAYKYRAIEGQGDISQTDGMYISVPSSETEPTTIYFYCGPQLKQYLKSYYNGNDNQWGLRDYNLDDAMESSGALGWLENGLKWCLNMLYKLIPNYGIGIIILTLIIKLVLWPLQKKSTESTAKMSALSPQLKEIQAKYPDNPQKQNEETQRLYQEMGVNPLGGCLPLLIQFPILIAFYGLLNKHFELRGAMFIPGWIPDLSIPETVCRLGFNIPLLGSEIHLLPFIYTASMIFSMKYTQASTPQQGDQKNTTMWFMTYGMPIMFFFILYAAPSGLLLYWTVQNALSIMQQVYTNKQVSSGAFDKKNQTVKKEPKAVLDYQEKLRKLEEKKNGKKGK